MSDTVALLAALTTLAIQASAPLAAQAPSPAQAQALAGAPTPTYAPFGSGPGDPAPDAGHGRECYAKVKFGAQYGVAPPTAPHYSWRQEPGPPGAPGPIWCRVAEIDAPRQILISPERYGWIRVLCEDEATPARIVGIQRQLSAAGVYQGPRDGRYDLNTTAAVQRFQAQRHIEDRGYLSYATLSALSAYSQTTYRQNGYYPAPNPYAYPQAAYPPLGAYAYPQGGPGPYAYRMLTTFDTGVLTWPGKR
jgi:hypothetical protein